MIAFDPKELSGLSDKWQDLERRIKDAEQVTGTACIPAINELRYSGRRFFEAWRVFASGRTDEQAGVEFREHVLMAGQYFNNADHDLVDSLISFYDERKRQILDLYGLEKTSDIYSRFIAWMEQISDAQDLIRSSRGDRENRVEYYKRIEAELLPKLAEQYKSIVRSEELYAARVKRNRFWGAINTGIGIIGWIAGMLCLYAEWDKIVEKVKGFF